MSNIDSDPRKNIAPYRVFFNWEITHECNYKCSYCMFSGTWGTKKLTPTIYPGRDKLIGIWHNIYERYGSCVIVFAGGEPFVYAEFMDLIGQLSKIHTLEFTTNLFWNIDDFIKMIKPDRVRIGVSFHPEFDDFDIFFSKALKIKKAGFEIWGNYVAFPPFMGTMQEYKNKFEERGISMLIQPFKGEYNNKIYPENYSDEERSYLRSVGIEGVTEKKLDFVFVENRKTQSRLCRMGQMYAKIHPDGEAYSCCRLEAAIRLGNLFDGTLSLLDEPIICQADTCDCWRAMLVGLEEGWLTHWPTPSAVR